MSTHGKGARLIAMLMGAFLIVTAASKLANMPRFAAQVTSYELLPEEWAPGVAYLVACAELLVGVTLVMGVFPRLALAASIALLGVFVIAVGWGWLRGCLEECGCFGELLDRTPAQAMAEDLALIALLVASYRYHPPVDPKRVAGRRRVCGVLAVLIVAAMANGWSYVPSRAEVLDAQVAGLPGRRLDSIPGYGGKPIAIPSSPTIVVFISTRCRHCIHSLPQLDDLYSQRGNIGFMVVAVNKRPEIPEFRRRFRVRFPILAAPYPQLTHLVHGVPEVLLVHNHRIVDAWPLPPGIGEVSHSLATEGQPRAPEPPPDEHEG
jgi:uncharacterized membrane protein YphA (DoxX/SURF4 family)